MENRIDFVDDFLANRVLIKVHGAGSVLSHLVLLFLKLMPTPIYAVIMRLMFSSSQMLRIKVGRDVYFN